MRVTKSLNGQLPLQTPNNSDVMSPLPGDDYVLSSLIPTDTGLCAPAVLGAADGTSATGDAGVVGRADGGQGGIGTLSVSASGNPWIDGLLTAIKWSSTSLNYSFPTSSADYGASATAYGDPAPFNGFAVLTTQQQNEVKRAFSLLSSCTKLAFTQITETTSIHAAIRLANSTSPPTSYAYYPSTSDTGGDVFYGGTGKSPVEGNFDSGQATLHEIGHALGLKHGQDNNTYGTVPANQLDIEYSLMNYANYIGSTEGFGTAEQGSSAQTYMMSDIAALQYMYGENIDKVGQTFVYTWSPTTGEEFINGVCQGTPYENRIFDTVWTAGATATYDLHVYAGATTLDLRPGKAIAFSAAQLADLGYYGTPGPGVKFAQGNIYNALLYNNDTSTEVSGLITGNGNNTVYANDRYDTIQLGTGNNAVYAGTGGAAVTGDGGIDTLIVPGARAEFTVNRLGGTVTVADSISSRGLTETLSGVRYVQFTDQTLDTASSPPVCDLSGSTTAVTFNLETGFSDSSFGHMAMSTGGTGTLIGSALNDTLIASINEGAYTFDGGGGKDTVRIDAVGHAGASISGSSLSAVTIAVTGTTIGATNIEHVRFIDGTREYDLFSNGAQVARLYQSALGRAPDAVGLASWVLSMNNGTALNSIADSFLNSAEFQSRFPGASQSTNAYVTQLYSNVLHRAPDAAGFTYWTNAINGGAITKSQALIGFSESAESQTNTAPMIQNGLYVADEQAAQVARLYYTTLNRAPDLAGLQYWVPAYEAGQPNLASLAASFTGSAEFTAAYGGLTNRAFVDLLYANALHRAPDANGEAGWVNALNTNAQNRNQVVIGFSESTEHMNALAPVIEMNGIKFAA